MQRVSRILSRATTICAPSRYLLNSKSARLFGASHAPSTSASADSHGHGHGAHDDHGHGHGGDPRNESHVFGEHSVSIQILLTLIINVWQNEFDGLCDLNTAIIAYSIPHTLVTLLFYLLHLNDAPMYDLYPLLTPLYYQFQHLFPVTAPWRG